jgi:hypothetical protein
MREWLSADHPVWLVIAAIGQIDTSAFHRHRRTGGVGLSCFTVSGTNCSRYLALSKRLARR